MAQPAPTRYATLDAWRGLACLLVVVSHSTLFLVHTVRPPDGDPLGEGIVRLTGRMTVGVPLFFVISGYCIAAAAESARSRGTGVGRYFARRFRRIYPTYWAALALTAALAILLERAVAPGFVSGPFGPVVGVPDPTAVDAAQWVGSVTLTETWRPLVTPTPERQILGPAWTLCYEEQFYAVTGLLLLVARGWFFAAVALVTAGVAAGVVWGWGGASVKGTFLDGRWLMFAAGVGVYWAVARGGRVRKAAVVLALLAAAGYACRDVDVLLDPKLISPLADGKELLPACLFALLLLAAHRWDDRTAATRLGRSLAGVGRYSYSLYLVHYPICLAVSHAAYRAGVTGAWETLLVVAPACVWLSMRAGEAFYRAVERRFTPPIEPAARPHLPAHT